ncbi:MAG TPA: SAM-dependent chlorinase/fluorinase, partial [Thermodesulfobacteriota bacterium]|nr:SAM-dependent chlorinase/fluorinase [Thermodesulfobacteriota bacterium]
MRNPIITLLTDFGTKDHYVASMKGVILGINPRCTLIDISHQVSAQDIREGAYLLASAFASFPKGTIHLSVVDPGVGGPRKPILIVTSNDFFVGPDNGIFTLALLREKVEKVVALTRGKYFLSRVSSTFHGRDVFAPVAAHLSSGVHPEAFGNEIGSWESFSISRPEEKTKELVGEILHIDSFGNLISNIDEETFLSFTRSRAFLIRVGRQTIQGLKQGYWEGKKDEAMALIGSGGFLEISLREGSAWKKLKVKRGDRIKIV